MECGCACTGFCKDYLTAFFSYSLTELIYLFFRKQAEKNWKDELEVKKICQQVVLQYARTEIKSISRELFIQTRW